MRRLRFLLIGLALISVSCVKDETRGGQDGSTPVELTISLSADAQTGAATTKAEPETESQDRVPAEYIPELADFEVELYKDGADDKEKLRLYRDTYANSTDKIIRLNTGPYRLLAQHGDSLGCGFEKPYFIADHHFELTPAKTKETVSAVARLGNVQLAVSFHETITGSYDDYYVIVRHFQHKNTSVKFTKDETRYGYIPAGDMVVEFYAYVEELNDWRYSKTEVRTFEPNDFVKFEVSSPRDGSVYFTLNVDGEETLLEDDFSIPDWAAPQEAPKLTLAGFDENNKCRVIEGVDVGAGGSVSILAKAAISKCLLSVESDILLRKGLPRGEYDLANADEQTKALLNKVGIDWDDNMLGSRTLSFINLAEAVAILNAETKSSTTEQTVASFSLKVVDEVNHESTIDFSVVSVPIRPRLDIPAYNVWATRVLKPQITVSEGANKSLFALQMSTDNIRWTTLENEISGNGLEMIAEDITGLESGKTYYFRVIYNNNPLVISDSKSVKTEAALQIGNNGFEEFSTQEFSFSTGVGSSKRTWYLPWKDGETDRWWAVNSRKTMPDNVTTAYANFKVFPTVTYTLTQKNKHAQIATVFVNNYADDSSDETIWAAGNGVSHKAVGEIFLGEANDDGTAKTLGHAFTSRPTSLTFDYWFTPYGSEKFYVRIDLLDSSGNVIAEAELPEAHAGAVDSWKSQTLTLNYKTVEKTASRIRLAFRSSTLSDADAGYASNSKVSIQIAGNTEEARLGSILLIDNVILNYE